MLRDGRERGLVVDCHFRRVCDRGGVWKSLEKHLCCEKYTYKKANFKKNTYKPGFLRKNTYKNAISWKNAYFFAD